MENENTVETQTENGLENETPKNVDTQTDEVGKGAGDVEKQEESPYARQLREAKEREEKLKADLAKKEEIIEHKNRALEAEKKKAKTLTDSETLREEARKAAMEILQQEKLEQKVNALTTDPAERELILRHYEKTVQHSGNLDEDLKNAVALANRDIVWEQKRNSALEERRESYVASFAPSDLRGEVPSRTANPIARQAEELVRLINPNAVQHVRKQFE